MTDATQLGNGRAENQTLDVGFQVLSLNSFVTTVWSATFWKLSVTGSENSDDIRIFS